MGRDKIFYLDLAERVVWTFIQGFLAHWVLTGGVDDNTLKMGLIAGGIAAAKVVLFGANIGDPNSGATLPSPPDHAKPTEPEI